MPVFAVHSVLFPGASMGLRVFEERYRALVRDVVPGGTFAIVAIRKGQEVGGSYEANRVGVTVSVGAHEARPDGSFELHVTGRDRVGLISRAREDPYPVWHVEPFPDEGGAGTDDVEVASAALAAYLRVTGETVAGPASVPHDPVAASYVLAAAVPGLVHDRQALLEIAGAGERLVAVTATFRRETALVRALGAGVGGAGLDVNPN